MRSQVAKASNAFDTIRDIGRKKSGKVLASSNARNVKPRERQELRREFEAPVPKEKPLKPWRSTSSKPSRFERRGDNAHDNEPGLSGNVELSIPGHRGGGLSTWAASGLYTGDHGIWLFAEERSSVTANNEAGGRRGAGGHLTSCSWNVNGINEPVKKGGELQADVNTPPPHSSQP